jgi:hypothetical protein
METVSLTGGEGWTATGESPVMMGTLLLGPDVRRL